MNCHRQDARYGLARRESGSGTVVVLGTVGLLCGLLAVIFASASVLIPCLNAQAVADQAALAAADSASGRIAGYPCEWAENIISQSSYEMVNCRVDERIARVTVSFEALGIQVTRRAQAGPP